MNHDQNKLNNFLIKKYAEFISDRRKEFIDEVLQNRTEHLTIVVEDLIDPHNINAIFRTGECFGVQHFHIIDNIQKFHIGRGVSKGATKWIDIHRYDQADINNSKEAIEKLKLKGYQILATSPDENAVSFKSVDISQPTALIFGNERDGISQTVKDEADQLIKIPMFGFTESFNVSVAAGILIQEFTTKIRKEVSDWGLSESQINDYKLQWYKKSMARPDYYHDYFVKAFELENN
ncbi:RNA methyltransferase [Marivirga atlantica]|uniref:tRNA (guanosine(18)-2'-O)-methyltransferase n=1 Tax=Marivirga atlantica TaxID=1548457 RepID=A0A937AFI5_9BACT|nr:RNA methyltransferase [Marivirga atlantica]MBL0765796.1 RNA methyltransferase [Marivirga atlantica]